jgi:inosine-uridine nucleoside N-ribohydrolase
VTDLFFSDAMPSAALLTQRLALPTGPVRAVLDTDTFNEVDDQFALAHALLSPDRITLEAVHAAPFVNKRADTPGEGMERSYEEIERVLALVGRRPTGGVFRGSTRYLGDPSRPVDSEAARDLIARAHAGPDPLYVIAIGAPTNVASALLLDPSIAEHIVVVWLGGHGLHWPHTREFNLEQDVAASRVLLESGVPLVLLPCMGVVQMLTTTVPELDFYLGGRGGAAEFLFSRVRDFPDKPADPYAWHKVIWDIAATAWVINPEWCPSSIRPAPVLRDDLTWEAPRTPGRHPIRYVHEVRRDPIFADVFRKLLSIRPST